MIELSTFGAVELRRDGTDVRSVLAQPKRLALLLYLRLEADGGFVARERLLGLFWPESDDERARNALRQSVHYLRRSLGPEAISNRSERELGVEPVYVRCDASEFRAALADGRLEDALELYRGDFLTGFRVEGAPDIERWIEDQRGWFAREAADAARVLSEHAEAAGEPGSAQLWARRAVALDPFGEAGVRRLMRLLAGSGERAAALECYGELAGRLARDLEVTPSPETEALAAELRRATVPQNVAPTVASAEPVRSAAGPEIPATPAPIVIHCAPPDVPAVRRPRPDRALLAAAAIVLIAALGWVGFNAVTPEPAMDVPPAVAVLPFVDMSAAADAAWFGDGIAEELLNTLARVPGLRVAARTSSFAFRDGRAPVDSIGRALGVTHVLEGSIRTDGERIRITAQLIETGTGFHLWSETYDRSAGDIFAVQDEIAAAIARRLQIDLAGNFWGVSEGETRDPEAYRMLLRALHAFRTPSQESYASSVTLLREAIQRDPEYARAYGALALGMLWQAYYGWVPDDAYARSDSLARVGLTLGETPEAHLALARLAEMKAWAPDSADGHFLRALELNPADTRALQYRALFLARLGRGDEAVASGKRATELDPLHPGSWVNYSTVLSILGREGESLAAVERARAVAPGDILVLLNLANQYSNVGRVDEALAVADEALAIDGNHQRLLGLRVHLLFRAGRTAEATARLRDIERRADFPRLNLASLYEHTGDTNRILDLLEEAAARREDELSSIRAPDRFVALRMHPRFQRLLRNLESGG